MGNEWRGFKGGSWEHEVNVRDFIQQNYTPYFGNGDFLEGPTQDTLDLWEKVSQLKKEEIENGGVLFQKGKVGDKAGGRPRFGPESGKIVVHGARRVEG